jgi:hypothetical protein
MKHRHPVLALAGLAAAEAAHACSACAPVVRARIHDADFLLNLVFVLLPVAVFGLAAWWLERGAVES